MPSLLERIEQVHKAVTGKRDFVVGKAVVVPGEETWGRDRERFTPDKYGEYLATSNDIYACANRRANKATSVPLKLYRGQGDKRDEVTKGDSRDLLNKVNPFWTFNRLMHMTELSMCLWGEAFWILETNGGTRAKEIWWAKPSKMIPIPHPTKYLSGFRYDDRAVQIDFAPKEVVWFRYPNPIDEYSGLSPLAAARLAADFSSGAMLSNTKIFTNGLQLAGILSPPKEVEYTQEQLEELATYLEKRFKGSDKAHRLAILKYAGEFKSAGITPKDAQFVEGLNLSFRQVCRAYGLKAPLMNDMEHATLANVREYERQEWEDAHAPELNFIASEITEQLLPIMGDADEAAFDLTTVAALQESEDSKWTRERGQLESGAITINEWRTGRGQDKVAWGDRPLFELLRGDSDSEVIEAEPKKDEAERGYRMEFGDPEHQMVWQRAVNRNAQDEERIGAKVAELFRRQQDSVISRLSSARALSIDEASDDPFDRKQWAKTFRVAIRPELGMVVARAGRQALDDLGIKDPFDHDAAQVVRAIERQAQRFAIQVNETTWRKLRKSLAEGIGAGEGIPALSKRVEKVMAARIRSSAEVIARTEVTQATTTASQHAWAQSGVVSDKQWIAALDERVRPTHIAAHGQTVSLSDLFEVGAGAGVGPGQIGVPEEDIQCRCVAVPVVGRAAKAPRMDLVALAALAGRVEALEDHEELPAPAASKVKSLKIERDPSGKMDRVIMEEPA